VLGEASTGKRTIRLARKTRPAVALIGSTLRGPDCLETVRSLKAILPQTQFIILTVRHTTKYVRQARGCGANYCLPVRTLDVRLTSLAGLAYRDFLVAAARNAPRTRRGKREPRAPGH